MPVTQPVENRIYNIYAGGALYKIKYTSPTQIEVLDNRGKPFPKGVRKTSQVHHVLDKWRKGGMKCLGSLCLL